MKTVLVVAALAPIALATGTAQQREPWPGYDAYVNAALATWKVPGVGIAIIRNDSIVYARGYGVREIGKADPVNERTIFAIGSSSKAFTAATLAMLVDEGKIRWDDAATKHLPNLQLFDPYATRELSVRETLAGPFRLGDMGSVSDIRNEWLGRLLSTAPAERARAPAGFPGRPIRRDAGPRCSGRAAVRGDPTWPRHRWSLLAAGCCS